MQKITNESLFEMKSVSQPLVFENYSFFLETSINKKENKYESAIYRLDLATGQRVLFGNSGNVNTQLQLTTDKEYLSYLSNGTSDEKVQLFTIPLNGGSARQITHEENGVNNYHWVEGSDMVYYQTSIKDKKDEADEEEEENDFPKKKVMTKLTYKGDGRGVLPEDRLYQIKKVAHTADETEAEIVLEKDRAVGLGYVAKDESYLLYYDRLDPEDEWVYGGSMYKYDVKAKDATLLTDAVPNGIFHFALANEAQDYFIFVGNDFKYRFVTDNHLYGYDMTTKTLTNLTPELEFSMGDSLSGDFQQNTSSPEIWWLEDGESFLFQVTEHGKITLYRGNKAGQVEKVVDAPMHITGLDLLPGNEEAIITYTTQTIPSVVGRLKLADGTVTDLYDPNETFRTEYAISESEEFWFKSVKNWDIQGWYLPPVDTKENHPAILYIHGGPQVSYGEAFFHEMQALAGAGYGVILLNPRGGSGYGQDFVASILDNYGDEDYQDLMTGTDYVLAQHPEIDQDRLYVAGGSYGGFMTNWIVTHTDRFKAAATQRSISNWLSFYGTSDIGPSFVEFQLGRDLSKADELWQMSPIAHAANAKTPLLVLHGEQDLRCPQEQGEQMYIAMKKFGVDTRFVTFPDSSHGLSREGLPNLRMERLNEIVDWFEKYQ